MPYSMTPGIPALQMSVNSVRVGAVRSFSEKIINEYVPVRAIGECRVIAELRKKYYYELTVSRPFLDNAIFPETQHVHLMQNFSLDIVGGGRYIHFIGCNVCSRTLSADANGSITEQLVLTALSRTEQNE